MPEPEPGLEHQPQPARSGIPPWLAIGVRVLDAREGRTGVTQLFRDDLGEINAERPILHPTRVLLRPLGQGQPWWARIGDLSPVPASTR